MRGPTLFLTVGLPGTGKTTAARRIEVEHEALRLTKDEWVKALYGGANPASASDVIEGRLIDVGLRALQLGVSVVIDFGLWGRDERSALRQAAADLGATVEMHYFELAPDEQRRRLDRRLDEAPHTTWHMSDEELTAWAAAISVPTPGEIDGTEPIDEHLRASPPGTAGADTAGLRRSPDEAEKERGHDDGPAGRGRQGQVSRDVGVPAERSRRTRRSAPVGSSTP